MGELRRPEEDGRRWQIDVTFLLSRWRCIFGDGCQGVLEERAPELILGCCSYGAHFTDKKDRDAVVKMARALGDDEWQFAKIGRKKGIYAKVGKNDDGSPDWRTRLVKDACIFLNRVGLRRRSRAARCTSTRCAPASTTATGSPRCAGSSRSAGSTTSRRTAR